MFWSLWIRLHLRTVLHGYTPFPCMLGERWDAYVGRLLHGVNRDVQQKLDYQVPPTWYFIRTIRRDISRAWSFRTYVRSLVVSYPDRSNLGTRLARVCRKPAAEVQTKLAVELEVAMNFVSLLKQSCVDCPKAWTAYPKEVYTVCCCPLPYSLLMRMIGKRQLQSLL